MNARERIKDVLDHEFENSEFYLVDVKQSGTKYQVFIDSDNSLSIDKCAEVSRKLEHVLEEENLVPEKYTLEVSSPGMMNPLKHVRQYKKRIGKELDIWTVDNIHHRGTLLEVGDQQLRIEKQIKEKKKVVGIEQIQIPIDEIKKAIVIFQFN